VSTGAGRSSCCAGLQLEWLAQKIKGVNSPQDSAIEDEKVALELLHQVVLGKAAVEEVVDEEPWVVPPRWYRVFCTARHGVIAGRKRGGQRKRQILF